MHYKTIKKLQKENDVAETQELINSGQAWTLEGSVGRACMRTLEEGETMLPKEAKYGAYGNKIPSRDEVKPGTKGSYKYCSDYWKNK